LNANICVKKFKIFKIKNKRI